MPHLLLIDRSETDRVRIRSILPSHSGWTVAVADSAAAAADQVSKSSLDLVLLDLSTAGDWEHRLIQKLRASQPNLPVILLTAGDDSDEFVVAALSIGAVSYVPKSAAAKNLVTTVQRILALNGCRRHDEHLQTALTCAVIRLHLTDNNLDLVRSTINNLVNTAEDFGLCDAANRGRLSVALDEALTNAVIHGNLDVPSVLREGDGDEFYQLVSERKSRLPYAKRTVTVTATYTHDTAKFKIADQGRGFDHANLMNPLLPRNLDKPHGRGVLLMRAFVDEVRFNEAGNCVTLIKRRPAAGIAGEKCR